MLNSSSCFPIIWHELASTVMLKTYKLRLNDEGLRVSFHGYQIHAHEHLISSQRIRFSANDFWSVSKGNYHHYQGHEWLLKVQQHPAGGSVVRVGGGTCCAASLSAVSALRLASFSRASFCCSSYTQSWLPRPMCQSAQNEKERLA